MQIDQKTIAEFVHLGGQYFLPAAALLRALYSGLRGKFPEGLSQIVIASFFAGLSAVVGQQDLNLRAVSLNILGNTVFIAGLLAFVMAYLLRQPNRGQLIDGIVGGFIGLIVFVVWIVLLDASWPWWTFPVAIAAGAAGFIVLRILLRQIARMVKLATYLLAVAVLLVIGAGGIMLATTAINYFQTAGAR